MSERTDVRTMILTPEQARAVVGGEPCDNLRLTGECATRSDLCCQELALFVPAPDGGWPVGEWVEVEVSEVVGRVRLGDPGPVEPESNNCPSGPHLVRGARSLGRCTPSGVVSLTHPHLDLWPDAFTPGSYAHPITEQTTENS